MYELTKEAFLTEMETIYATLNEDGREYLLQAANDMLQIDRFRGKSEAYRQASNNPRIRALFNAAKACSPEEIDMAADLLQAFKKS